LILVLFFGSPLRAFASDCASPKPQAWVKNRFVEYWADCSINLLSPDGKLTLHIDGENGMSIRQRGMPAVLNVQPKILGDDSNVLWSPTSQAFLARDGRGSGQGSLLRVFIRNGNSFTEETAFRKEAIRLYRSQNKCARDAYDPDVYPMGWSADGKSFYAYIQATTNFPCGHPENFLTVEMDVDSRAITHIYSPREARRKFPRSQLP